MIRFPPFQPMLPAILLSAIILAGCGARPRGGPIAVSVIGPPLAPGPGADRAAGEPGAVLRASLGQGLVRFDEAGQLIPGAAIRWAMFDDGRDNIFRIADGMAAMRLAVRLRAGFRERRPGSGRPMLGGVDRIAAVTSTVIELRLADPRPDLLALLARPAFAAADPGGGPFRIAGWRGTMALLARRPTEADAASAPVLLRGERAGVAVARFAAGQAALVLGGRFTDLAVARSARLPRGALRFDHPTGLMGFAIRARDGPFAEPAVQQALSQAIDRDRIVALLGAPRQAKATTATGSAIEGALDQRRAFARMLLARRPGPALPPLRVAMPPGPGARLLFRLVAQDWGALGIAAIAVEQDAPADLELIDEVGPASELGRMACEAAPACDPADRIALLAPPYIPLMAPVRWSLVAPGLDLFTENGYAAHPLDRLRRPR